MKYSAIVLAPVLGLLAACGGGNEAANPPASMTERVTAAAVGAATGLEVSVTDLPDFVVLPKGGKAISRMSLGDGAQRGGTITLETSQSPSELLAFYRGVMADKGLTVAMENVTADSVMLMGGDEAKGQMLNVVINPGDDGKTNVTLTHAVKTATADAG